MFDFLKIECTVKNGKAEIRPDFSTLHHDDLLIRGGDFYAAWIEEKGLWSTNETDVIKLVDQELWNYAEKNKGEWMSYKVYPMELSSSKMINRWHKYCKEDLRDTVPTVSLDQHLTFANTKVKKKDYVSKKLLYALEKGDYSAYDKLMSKLYSPEERHKLEWAIGSVVAGHSEHIQKFIIIYGEPGKGKSTVLKLIEEMFDGYCGSFDAQTLGMASKDFAMEPFKDNPLIAIDHEAKLDKIESNRNLNSIVSHDRVPLNTKYQKIFRAKIRSFLFMAANDPVKITNVNSGLMRRMIDVSPTGKTFPEEEYDILWNKIGFEYGAIAWHCKEVYEANPRAYSNYKPINMITASNDFYNFMLYNYMIFDEQDGVSQKSAWEMYKSYCEMGNTPMTTFTKFKEEIKNYFETIEDRHQNEDGTRTRTYYSGFKRDRFRQEPNSNPVTEESNGWIEFKKIPSVFDSIAADYPAQYGDDDKTPPIRAWTKVKTTLKDLDTSLLHYVRVPVNHIVIDFDIPDENGNKCLELNLKEANKWPKTYAELSKSGQGIHLHYIYTGDPEQLSRNFDDKIEVKVFTGLSSLRRKLSLCNDLPIEEISSGLPLKEERKMISEKVINDSKHLEAVILKSLKRNEKTKNGTAKVDEILHTRPCIDLIDKVLKDAYDQNIQYDMKRLYGRTMKCAMGSSNNKDYCVTKVSNMKWRSDEIPEGSLDEGMPIVFYDVEVFPNLFVLNWKFRGESRVYRMINPKPDEVVELMKFRLVGFNCRRYDNHIIFAWGFLHYTNAQLYNLSQSIITHGTGFFGTAYNLSWTDIYDFASKKQSLKKWEIEFKFHHKELGLRWDEPVPEEKWGLVAEYCDNDVLATELCFEKLQADFEARKILAELAGGTVNDSTNSLTAKLIFGRNKHPQSMFNYRNLALPVGSDQYAEYRRKFGEKRKYRVFNSEGLPEFRDYNGEPLPEGWSFLPFFPGYTHENGVSVFMGETIGEGGRVYADPAIWYNVWDGDATSMHPTSVKEECAFGPEDTERYYNLVRIRIAIKHKDYNFVRSIEGLGEKLAKYLEDDKSAKGLAYALKIAINAVYGQTSASYENPFLDIRNKDNFIAKRGALFMTVLKNEVQKRGFKVAHIKTDSIKIPDATPEIKQFVIDFAKEYGYSFETEDEFDKMCLVNDAVFIAHRKNWDPDDPEEGWKRGWTATGTQFKVPYVFKTLFAKAPIEFDDLCETKELKVGLMYLDMNEGLPEGEHDRVFVGRIGQFCPIAPGFKGGELVKEVQDKEGNIKYDSVTGCKGYRWLESETVKELGKEDCIDISYYRHFVDKAVETIGKFGDFEAFAA